MVFNSGYIDLIGFEIIGHWSVKPRCYWLQCFKCNKWKSSETDKSIYSTKADGIVISPGLNYVLLVLLTKGAFHLSELEGQSLPNVMRISLLIKTIQAD